MSDTLILTPEEIKKYETIQLRRAIALQNDSSELRDKRMKFLDWLNENNINIPQVLEMYQNDSETIYGKKQIGQYYHEVKFANTRTQTASELRAEVDKLEFDKAMELCCQIIQELINHNIHFAVFYAQGQRSPHIIIYDFHELEQLNPFQRTKARAKFWRWLIPFRIHLIDNSLFDDSHFVPLEFSIHWKHKTPFDLLFEYNPNSEVKNAKVTN